MKRLGQYLHNAIILAAGLCIGMTGAVWILGPADTFAWSQPAYLVGLSCDGEMFYLYYGKRYMTNRDGVGYIHRSDSSTVWPIDRMDNVDWVYFRNGCWGTAFTGVALQAWSVFGISVLVFASVPLARAEVKLRSRSEELRNRRLGNA